jgi:hypothetical protein
MKTRRFRYRSRAARELAAAPINQQRLSEILQDALRQYASREKVRGILQRWNRQKSRPWARLKCETFIEQQDAIVTHERLRDQFEQDEVPLLSQHDSTALMATAEERERYWKVSNEFFDRHLPMPAAFKLVWLCLQRHANGRKGRIVYKISQERMALECGVDPRVVAAAIRYLSKIGAIVIKAKGGAKRHGTRNTTVYQVPPLGALNLAILESRMLTVPADARLTRPDAKR